MDEDILKTLRSIEKLLSRSMAGAGDSTVGRTIRNTANQRADKESAKQLKAVASASLGTKDSILGLNKSMNILNSQVSTVSVSFGSLNSQLNKFIGSLQRGEGAIQQPIAQPINAPIKAAPNLVQALKKAITPLNKMNDMKAQAATMPNLNKQAADILKTTSKVAAGVPGKITPRTRAEDIEIPIKAVLGRMVENFARTVTTGALVHTMFGGLADITRKLTSDFFSLARIGLGSQKNLQNMSISALQNGMSLKEYTETLKSANTFASRVSSIDEYERVTSAANAQLATLGVFGAESKAMQASLANSNTMMGISQDQIIKANRAQIDAFDDLRKTTNMTAEEFSSFVNSLAQSETVQKELLGVGMQSRVARQQEITQIATTGQRLGLTAEASQKLTDALLAQRGDTVKGRFESAARLRQAAAFAGMGAEGERGAQIAMKGRRATASETEELRGILGRLESSQQQMYENGTIGSQNVIDQMSEALGSTGIGKVMDANRQAVLAEQSGAARGANGQGTNEDFGKHVGAFGQAVGQLGTYLRGFQESVGSNIAAVLGTTLLALFRGPIVSVLARVIGGGGGAAGGIGAGLASAGSKLSGILPSIGKGITGLASSATAAGSGILSGAANVARGGVSLTQGVASVANLGKSAFTGISGLSSGLLGGFKVLSKSFGPLAGIFDAAIEAFTGEIASGLSPNGGWLGRLEGIGVAFATAIPNMLIDVFGFVFGDQAGTWLQNKFDIVVAGLLGVFKFAWGKILSPIASIATALLPADSGLAKSLNAMKDTMVNSANDNFDAVKELAGDGTKTLKTIGKENQRAAEANTVSATKATDTSVKAQAKFNNVAQAGQVTAAQIIQDAKSVVGVPSIQVPAQVQNATPGVVNTQDEKKSAEIAKQKAEADKTQTSVTTQNIVLLEQILAVLRESLSLEQSHLDASTALLDKRPAATFMPSEVMANQLIKRNFV